MIQELSWKNAAGLQLYAAHWPVEQPQAVIALVHGQGEHIGRYQHVADWFNQQKIALVGYDQQGYGRSDGPRGHAPHVEALMQDIGLLLDKTKELYPNVPLFLYGHSMGGNLVLNYALRYQPVLSGLIATGPQIRLAFDPPAIKIWAGKLLRNVLPTLAMPTGLPLSALSTDPAVVKAYADDPLVHDKLSTAAAMGILEAAAWLNGYSGAASMPMLLQHGAADQITAAAGTRDLASRLRGDVTYKEWPDLYHEIHNEPNKKEIFQYTLNWLLKHLPDK